MDFQLSDEQEAIRHTFHEFASREIRPQAAELDEHPRFPRELFTRAGELGFYAMRYPEPEGTGHSVLTYALAVEELAWGSLAVAAACTMQSLMGTYFVHRFTQGELRERLLTPALAGHKVGTICMTEPDSGSDLMSMSTRAELRKGPGDGPDGAWFITGAKTWITSAPVADFFTVFARTGESPGRAGKPPRAKLGIFLVERDTPGLQVGRTIDKMGVKASLTSELFFEDVRALTPLGDPGEGLSHLKKILAEIRVMTAALALGIARAAFEEACRYAGERVQFGRPIRKFQAVQAHMAEMAVDLQAARQLTYWAAWRSDQGLANDQQAAMAKLFASEAALRTCERAARIVASYGFATDSPIQRYLRDVRFLLIGGGTSEVLRNNIAREL